MKIEPAQSSHYQQMIKIWHDGWHEAHAELVPKSILKFRDYIHFWEWLRSSSSEFFVGTEENWVIGFIAIKGSEVDKLFVTPSARGSGTASTLLEFGRRRIAAAGNTVAYLYCTAGNLRAEAFYRREGWELCETFPATLWVPKASAEEYSVETCRFEKVLCSMSNHLD